MQSANHLLARLSEDDFGLLSPHLERVAMPRNLELEAPNAPIDFVHFIESGIASVLTLGPTGDRLEAGILGREGMTGCALLHGADRVPLQTMMQVEGEGVRIAAQPLRDLVIERPSIWLNFLLFSQAKFVQVAYTARSNGVHTVEQRLAAWVLMCHDRVDGNRLEMTHQFLAHLLGVRRAGITTALHVLEGGGGVKSTRGLIEIRNRAMLEDLAGAAYGTPEREYERLLGDPRTTTPALQPV